MSNSKLRLLDTLFRRHSPELLAFAHSRVGDAAEDVLQEAFLRLLQQPDSAIINNPRAYLYKVTANLGFDYLRKESVRNRYTETEAIEPDSVHSPLPGPETITEGELLMQNCLTALETLPEIVRYVFLLHRIDGLSHKAIAKALQLPQRTVERYCAKALAHCFAHDPGAHN